MQLEEKESVVLANTVTLWNSFLECDSLHPDDVNDFRFHIHALQNLILSRPMMRIELLKGNPMKQIG